MSNYEGKALITKLNNENYALWKFKMEMVLSRDDLWEIATGPTPAQPTPEWLKANRHAKAAISLSVEDSQLIHIRALNTAKEMWDALRQIHERSNLSNKLYISRKLYKTRMEGDVSMGDHLNKMLEMVMQLRALGEDIKDNQVAALLLSSLPDTYDSLITALEARPEEELSLELVKGKLMDEAKRKDEHKHDRLKSQETVLNANVTNPKRRETRTCYNCNKVGHISRNCRLKKQTGKPKHTAKLASSENTSKDEEAYENICFSTTSITNEKEWFIDSGATAHMTNDIEFFTELSNLERPDTITLADGSHVEICGVGRGYLNNESNGKTIKIELPEVLFIPKLKGSLLSVKRLTKLGFEVSFKELECSIRKDKHEITAKLRRDLYTLECKHTAMIANAHPKNCVHLWHRKLGHRNINAILELNKLKLVKGLDLVDCKDNEICKTCVNGKMTRKPFPAKAQYRAKRPYELVHSDICGPMQTETPGGKRYLAIFVDDFSRYTESYLLRYKSELESKLEEFMAKANNKFNRKLEKLRTDGGGEYINKNIEHMLVREGIERQTTVAYSPQQNGMAERKNRSLLEMARCMLIDANLTNEYWGEAVMTATYIQNRVLHSACPSTPYEMWHGNPPNMNHLKVFGSKAFVLIPSEKLRKLDTKTLEGKMVGYSKACKGYRILLPGNKIIISRDVMFDENIPGTVIETCEEQNEVVVSMPNLDPNSIKEEPKNGESEPQIQAGLRRSSRINLGIPPEKLTYLAHVSGKIEPQSWSEVQHMDGVNKQNWINAVNEEMSAFKENKTWELTELPDNKQAVGCKWVFKIKEDEQGNVCKYKARLVAKGYSQKYGEDYDSVFAPVVKYTTIRTLLSIAAQRNMKTKHMDVHSAFLNSDIKEEIYMQQPEGQISPGNEGLVYRLNKCVYGLKQSAKEWNDRINEVLIKLGFARGEADQCLYFKTQGSIRLYVLIYVDDLLICTDTEIAMQEIQQQLQQEFKMKDLGEIKLYLGIQIEKDEENNYYLHQKTKIEALLNKFGMSEAKGSKTPMESGYLKNEASNELFEDNNLYRQGVGALLYIATVTRPDISIAVGLLGRKVSKPAMSDWCALKRLLRYLKYSINAKIKLGHRGSPIINGYVDADWGEDVIDRKSTTGYIFNLGESLVSWASRKQTSIALSTSEAEYVAGAAACQEIIWLRQLMKDLGEEQTQPTILHEDNQSCIKMATNEKYSNRTKHIDIKFHMIRDCVKQGLIKLVYCATQEMVADVMTKPLGNARFNELYIKLGMC